ncbi:TVP38/TMEM64 family protein [Paenibacillus pasadenensis]|uniref:TVP38/TMEM64 family membrane protein n=1 Tax=Paenibacillus pasadenensis TaxID=217090 RepID=A0A2N5NBZ0_9BACL|nr:MULTISPECIES: TVP38/TMEM64 family protein [Paenibacillus]PLT47862.1 Alkaline phosphatase like protein [Paenibacillus pasadenensis]QGG58022.1 TVP38/TMEM64 family protein [Paenibacillus sp. B01]
MNHVQKWLSQLKNMNLQQLEHTLQQLSHYGPLPGILLPFAEAFLPFLPLFVFIAANANIYGLGLGFLYSWIGVSAGSICVFAIARSFGSGLGMWLERRFPRAGKFFDWLERRGFTPVFLLSCFPFSPSVLVNIASGLSSLPLRTFLLAVLLGKAVMIMIISLLSFNIGELAPWRIAVAAVVVVAMWLGGKKLEMRYLAK